MNFKVLTLLLVITPLIIFSSCNDSGHELEKAVDQPINYYIKYEHKTSSRYIYKTVEASLVTEKGFVTMTIPRNWEGTFGPFCKLEHIVFTIKCDPQYLYNTSIFNGRISICKEGHPFILKTVETASNAPLIMTYQVTSDDLK